MPVTRNPKSGALSDNFFAVSDNHRLWLLFDQYRSNNNNRVTEHALQGTADHGSSGGGRFRHYLCFYRPKIRVNLACMPPPTRHHSNRHPALQQTRTAPRPKETTPVHPNRQTML